MHAYSVFWCLSAWSYMFPGSYVLQVLCSLGPTFPWVPCSPGPIDVPQVRCSLGPMFPRFHVPWTLCFPGPIRMFLRPYVPWVLYVPWGPRSPGPIGVLRTLCSLGPTLPWSYRCSPDPMLPGSHAPLVL